MMTQKNKKVTLFFRQRSFQRFTLVYYFFGSRTSRNSYVGVITVPPTR